MKSPDFELLRKALDHVVKAEENWRQAWNNQIPAIRTDHEAISRGLSGARESLKNLLRQQK